MTRTKEIKAKASVEAVLILDNIRSTHNVGSIFRTADAAGVSKIYCIGTTPAPIDRFGRKRADIAKVSLGAEDTIPWEQIGNDDVARSVGDAVKNLKRDGFTVVSLEQDERSVDYRSFSSSLSSQDRKPPKVALILGNEVGGVSKDLLDVSDEIIEIPMAGKKESLNVAVAAGVALFALKDGRPESGR